MENTESKTWHKYNKDPNVPSGTGKAFELPNFFYEEILSPKELNRPQKVVTFVAVRKKMREKGNSYIWHKG